MTLNKRLILVTNDDGITAPGIRSLIKVMRQLGMVVVAAPDKPQSGMGHAITVNLPLRYHLIAQEEDYTEYSINGTPVDCVKLAEKYLLPRRPDLIVSGINHGSNASINILYSGTMAAVLEGVMLDIPSIGFSLCDYVWEADFTPAEPWVEQITRKVLQEGLPRYTGLNINIPVPGSGGIKGIKVVRQGEGRWEEEFEHRVDPRRRDYFWITGHFKNYDGMPDTDLYALDHGYISVVPVHYDFTAHQAIPHIKNILEDAQEK